MNNAKPSQTDLSWIWIAFWTIFAERRERFHYGSKNLATDSLTLVRKDKMKTLL